MAHLTDEELQSLPRGGHDYRKLYAAYKAATEHVGAPTAILAKTIKGWTLGPEIEARNATHQIKKMTKAQLLTLRNRLFLHDEIPESALDDELPPYFRPRPRREGRPLSGRAPPGPGWTPAQPVIRARPCPPLSRTASPTLSAGSGRQAVSTTMAFARLLRSWSETPPSGDRIVPIVSDEARTFGLEPHQRSSRSTLPKASATRRSMPDWPLHYAESALGPGTARRASARRGRWPHSPPRRPPTPRGASR